VRRAATLLLLLLAVPAAAEERPIWLAVGPEPLLEAIAPLAEHRRLEGLEPILSSRPAAEAIRAAPRPPAYLLLVGDDEPGQEAAPWYHAAPRRELYRWARRQDETFAADTLLGDLDGDLVPDIPVGRLPCRSPQEVAAAVAKIRLREDRPPTTEDLALPVWSCATLFGDQMDALSTGLVLVNLRRHAPEWVRPWVLTSIPRRPFCGVPAEQPRLFSERLRRGGQIAAIVAHADRTGVLAMREKGRRVVYTARTATETFAKGPPGPPLFVIACLAGDFTAPKPCFAEELLAMPGGPVAVVAATTESHPLTNYYSSVELLRALGDRHDRLGDLWLAAQRSALEQLDPLVDMALRNVEGSLEPSLDGGAASARPAPDVRPAGRPGDPPAGAAIPDRHDAARRRRLAIRRGAAARRDAPRGAASSAPLAAGRALPRGAGPGRRPTSPRGGQRHLRVRDGREEGSRRGLDRDGEGPRPPAVRGPDAGRDPRGDGAPPRTIVSSSEPDGPASVRRPVI
jgi:hypothetical protein